MFDLNLGSCTGAVRLPKSRIIWNEGELRVFNKQGHLSLSVPCDEPVRNKGWLKSWRIVTAKGESTLTGQCRCGWRKSPAAKKSATELWNGQAD